MSLEKALDRLKKVGEINCTKCGNEIDSKSWSSEWDEANPEVHHYKSFSCDCGKKNWIKVDFPGSGHDELFDRKKEELKSAVRTVREGD
tara:strand:+ start:124 stop:390 length:267 start_codon:yes stop_codon:yes gene_type:complete